MARHSPTLRSVSPFRYPGGKAFLYKYLLSKLLTLAPEGRSYAEPFCGGAGAALILLKIGAVSTLHLNDADIKVYSAWRAILDETDRFINEINTVNINLRSWHDAQDVVQQSSSYSFELGFATFFLNRTSRSGIIMGSGPIGGYNQDGNWKIDARFNREALAGRVHWLGQQRNQISLTNEDALTFLSRAPLRMKLDCTLFFIDPPYVTAGGRLYLNAMNESKHIALSDLIQNSKMKHWILTYDNHPLIRELYSASSISNIDVVYSLQNKRSEKEIIISNQEAWI